MDHHELIEYLDKKFLKIDERFEQLPTRSYVDRKFAEVESRLTLGFKQFDYKLDFLIETLQKTRIK